MRVICVSPINKPDDACKNYPRPQVGDIDIVLETWMFFGQAYYVLERFSNNEGFLADCFATLPDTPAEVIEEPEMMEA